MIKAIYNTLFILSFIFLIIPLLTFQCSDLEEPSSFGTVLDYHIERSNIALTVWEIGLPTNNLADSRNTDSGYQYNPANWIVAVGDECIGEGIPDSFKSSCPFSDSLVIGLCSVRYYTGGEGLILDTTLLIYRGFQENDSIFEEEKQSIYNHEIGHCLGLSHTNEWTPTGDSNYLMYPNTDGHNLPHLYELNAIKSVYKETTTLAPSGGEGGRDYAEYFIRNSVTDTPLRHKYLPIFHIYPYDYFSSGLSFYSSSGQVARGIKLEEEPRVVNFYYYSNGDLKEEYIDEYGNIEKN